MEKAITYLALLTLVLSSCGGPRDASKSSAAIDNGQESVAFQELFFRAQQAKVEGNPEKAIGLFEQASELNPANDAVWYELARIQHSLKAPTLAQDYINKALALDNDNLWYHDLQATLYKELDQPAEAEGPLREILRLDPSRRASYLDLIDALMAQGKSKAALQVLDDWDEKNGVSPEMSLQRYNLLMYLEQADEGTEVLKKLVEDYPAITEFKLRLVDHYMLLGNSEAAGEVLNELGSIDASNGQLQIKLSEFYASQGEDDKSFEAMVRAFEATDVGIDQKIGVMMKFYTLTELNPDYLEKSYRLLEVLETRHPSDPKAFAISGDFLLRDGRKEEARSAFAQAVALDPSRDLIWQQLLNLDLELSDYPALESNAKEAMELFPVAPQYYLFHGIASLQLDKPDQAIKSLKSGKSLVIENKELTAQFWAQLGDAYHAAGNNPESDNAYDKALELDPDNVFVLNNYAYYLSLRGEKLDKAESMSKRSNDLEPGQASFLDTLGWIYYQQGQYANAIEWLEKANEAELGRSGEILEHLGDAHYMNGSAAKALEIWKLADAKPGGSDALKEKIRSGKLGE